MAAKGDTPKKPVKGGIDRMEKIIVDFVVVCLKSNSENLRRPLTFHRRIFSRFLNVMDFKMALCPKSARKSVWRLKSPTLHLIVCHAYQLGKLETLLNFTISSTRAYRKGRRSSFLAMKQMQASFVCKTTASSPNRSPETRK